MTARNVSKERGISARPTAALLEAIAQDDLYDVVIDEEAAGERATGKIAGGPLEIKPYRPDQAACLVHPRGNCRGG